MIYLVSNQTNAFGGEFTQVTLSAAIAMLDTLEFIGTDTETKGLDCFTKDLLTIQLGNKDIQIVFDIASYSGKIPPELKEYLNASERLFILQNAKFDLQFLYRQGVVLKKVYDTMLVETILTIGLQEKGRDLKTIVKKYCDVDLDKSVRGEIITKGLNAAVIRYAAYDVVYLEDIMIEQMKQVRRLKLDNAVKLDNEFVKVLAYIEYCGIKLDWRKWKAKSLKDLEDVSIKKKRLDDWLIENGHTKYFSGMFDMFTGQQDCILNWNSSQQVIGLFESLGINCTIKDKGVDKKTVEEKAIGKYRKDFPILDLYFDFKAAIKLTSTYGLSWEKMINPVTHRIHTNFKQIMNTGRLSSGDMSANKPNLQNLPSDELTRSCFIAEPGHKYIAVDYSSQEQIVLANFSGEKNLINFYRKGFKDMHSYVAFLMYPNIRKCTIEELEPHSLDYIKKDHPDLRYLAKTAGFAINYGGNGSTIAKNTGISKKEGEFVYNNYFSAFPGLKDYFDYVLDLALHNHYILFNSLTGRKLFISADEPVFKYAEEMADPYFWQRPNARSIQSEYNKSKSALQRKAQNYPIQGSSADCSKLAGIILFNQLIQKDLLFKVKIVNMVHDEFNVEAPEEIAEEISDLVVNCMKAAGIQFCKTIPLSAESQIGDHWLH